MRKTHIFLLGACLAVFQCFMYSASAESVYPDGSTPYLKAENGAYIDTGVPARTGVKIDINVAWLAVAGDFAMFAARVGNDRFYPVYVYNSCLGIGADGAFKYLNGDNPTELNTSPNASGNVKLEAGRKYNIVADFSEEKQTITLDGKLVYSGNHASGMDLGVSLYLFCMNYVNKCPSRYKFYDAKIWLDGELVREYVPHVVNGNAGVYDKVNETFQQSAGNIFDMTPRYLDGKPDAFVEWIGGGNNVIMPLDIYAKSDTIAEGTMEWTYLGEGGSDEYCFLGARDYSRATYMVFVHSVTKKLWLGFGETKIYPTDADGNNFMYEKNIKYDFRAVATADEQSLTLNGTTVYSDDTVDSIDVGGNFYLFGLARYHLYSYAKCYKLKFWQDGVLIADFYPAVKNGKGCLYDTVTDRCFFAWEDIKGKYIGKPVEAMGSSTYKQPRYPLYEVEYLESEGLNNTTSYPPQWLNTGVIGRSGTKCEIDVEWADMSGDYDLLGARTSESNDTRFYLVHIYRNKLSLGYQKFVETSVTMNTYERHTIVSELSAGEQKMYLDGVEVYSGTNAAEVDTGLPLYLFYGNIGGKPMYQTTARVYSLKLWQDGELVRDFVPVMADTLEPCFYDRVGKKLYPSDSETAFWSCGDILGVYFKGSTIIIR